MCKNIIILVLLPIVLMSGCEGVRPSNLGVKNGKLAPCPDSPNCVSSQSTDKASAIAPLTYTSTAEEAFTDLKRIISNMKNATLVEELPNYLHYEFRSSIFRFVDDVEFYFDDTEKKIHFRSASRLGYWDLGVNRKRMEKIRQAWKNH